MNPERMCAMNLSSIRRVMAGLRHDYFGRVYVPVMKAFIDDSGSGSDSPWYVLAGYVGTVEAWDLFGATWLEVLNGPPKLEYFKASEAESLRPDGQWAGVTKEQRNTRLNALIDVIGKFATRAFYVRTMQKDYDEIIKPYVPPRWDNAYFFLFIGCIAAATSLEKYTGAGNPIDFVFDTADKKRIVNPSLLLYDQVSSISQFSGRITNVHYEDEKIFLPLQAADLLAWQIRRRYCAEEENRPQFEMALNAPPQLPYSAIVTRDDLKRYGETMDNTARTTWALQGLPENMRPWRRPCQ